MSARDSLADSGLRPRKKWGQNFLTDARILESIADAAELTSGDTVLEIGPGLGHLTRVLADRAARVVAVEIDKDLAARLQETFAANPRIVIMQGDILTRDPVDWLRISGAGIDPAPHFKVVANLPYYITSAILRHLLESEARPSIVVVMVQREVAQRMTATPPAMNLLAVSVQFFARVHVVRTIAPGAFYPRPKVESAVVRLDVFDRPPLVLEDTARFFELVRAGFGERRKQLRNSLAHGLALDPPMAAHLLGRAHIDPSRRAETLTLDEWGTLYHAWARFPIVGEPHGV
jgi:16S rRNA (adenine1518-N6/adenine1519-N6)-dimethyltransferase